MPIDKTFCHNTGILHGAQIGAGVRKKGSNLPAGGGVLSALARPLFSEDSMSRKFGTAAILVALVSGVAAHYGGWATVTVENLPDQLLAGTPYNLTFSVRQHGVDLLGELTPYVQLKSGDTELTARAAATNKRGYYTATLNVPKAGNWSADIQTSFGKSHLQLMPITAQTSGARAVSFTPVERGQRLFVAKGCVSCHQHAKVEDSGTYKVGPELTDKRFAAAYLRDFLADPSIKPPTKNERMPNLNLNDREISALIAFINGEAGAGATKASAKQ
jgi:cytochrome c551/c552